MKKLYALAAACVVAASASAQLYVTGPGESFPSNAWDAVNPMVVNADANGNYTFTAPNLTQLKMSKTKGDWDAFNGGALYCSVDASQLGQPIALVNGNGNILTPWPGDYTITVSGDYSTATFTTTTPKPVEKIDIYVRGNMNGWGASDDWKFQTDDYIHYSLTCKIAAGEMFKIADANWSRVNYGGEAAYGTYSWWYNGSDSKFSSDFEGTISFTLDNPGQNELKVTFTEPPFEEPGISYSVWGNLDGSMYNTESKMTLLDNGVWQLADILAEGGNFVIQRYDNGKLESTLGRENGTSAIPDLGTAISVSNASTQTWYLARGYYTITYNAKNGELTVTGNTFPDSYEIPTTLYVIGNVDGAQWATDKGVEGTKEGNVFNFTSVEVNPSDEGAQYGYFSFVPALASDWETINSSDRYGASYNDAPAEMNESNIVFIYRASGGASNVCAAWKIKPGIYNFSLDFDNMELMVSDPSGIEDINAEVSAAPVYYNLHGVMVAEPSNGLFIEKRGNSVRKVLVK